jgi:hypothetical protein
MDFVPGYWRNETSGVLRPAIETYLAQSIDPEAADLTPAHIGAIRAYLRQWMASPVWRGPMIDVLRTQIGDIATRADIDRWLARALDEGIDPL